ncbi:hypothetical protein FOCC_FOCC008814 [Frankliniella occidentalis]|nr:hypothetical protein FOCC_FOCC008814 [Frankliniella occidentalis]
MHVSAPPITANGSVPAAASGTTVTPVTTSWPSPTAAPRGQLPVAAAPTAPVTAKTKTATTSTARPPTLQTRPTMAPPRAKLPRMTSTAMPAAPTVPKKSPTAQTVTTPSQAERPNAADATASTVVAATSGRQDAVVSAASAKVAPNTRPPDDEQYPMYAEYPDVSVNLTNAGPSGGDSTEGDVVPDPDAALRQEDDERERASLAGDDPPDNMQFLGEATAVQQSPTREDIIPEDPNVGVLFGSVADIRIAGDVSGAVSGDLEAGFEHAPVEEGAVVRDDLLGMPVEPQDPDLRERDRLDGDAYRDRERAELQLHNQGAAGKQVNSFLALRGLRFACNKDEADKELVAEGGDDRDGLRDGLRDGRDLKDPATPAELRSSLRAAAIMLPLYSADWFLGVVAMDNSTTLAYPLLFLNWFLMVCAWLIVPRESNKEAGDWCGGAEGEDLDEEEEYLMEEDDAGCWGKSSSSSASLLGNYYGDACNPGLLSNGEIVVWGIDTSDAAQNNSGAGDARLYGRWDEAAAATQTRDAEQLSGPGAAPGGGPGGAIPGAQELAEMRYDGAISTIST